MTPSQTRAVLHAIAVLGVKPKPLRGRLATASSEYIPRPSSNGEARLDPCARRWLSCYQDVLLTEPADGRFRQQNVLIANNAAPADRSHPQGRSGAKHPPWRHIGGYRFARTFEAPWRVDGDRAAWRRGVESKSSAPPPSAGFPRTALRLRGNDRRPG